jgi:hypothetical protein
MKFLQLTTNSAPVLIACEHIVGIELNDPQYVVIRTLDGSRWQVDEDGTRVVALLEEANDEGPGLPGPMLNGGTLKTRLHQGTGNGS